MMRTADMIQLMARKRFVWNRRTWLTTKNTMGPLHGGHRGAATTYGKSAASVKLGSSTMNTSASDSLDATYAKYPLPLMDPVEETLPLAQNTRTMNTKMVHKICSCATVNHGKQIVIEFADQSRYQFHTEWLKDASPDNVGADFYRTSAADVSKLKDVKIVQIEVEQGGEWLMVQFDATSTKVGTEPKKYEFSAKWLRSFAPFVGKALNTEITDPPELVQDTGSLFNAMLCTRKPWLSDLSFPTFDAKSLASNTDLQIEFLEKMVDPGVAMITHVDPPQSLEREMVGKPLEDIVKDVIGKLNQHPVRSTRYGVIRKTAESAKQGADYDMSNPLSMHTDHSVYFGTPGYLQFLYQAQGSVSSKVCDGLAVAEYIREHYPASFKLLSTVKITHSSRNELYTREGVPRDINDKSMKGMPFELVHTHPVIELNADGCVEKVVQSETKRGVCALPYSVYEPFMEAYELWTQLCEDPRFIKHFPWPEGSIVVTNNWRTLHGRASVPPGMARTMAFGYVNKTIVENRYRLLKQNKIEHNNPSLDYKWLTRMPNQVLEKLTTM